MTLGVTPLSWAQWLARSLDLPFTSYAFNGATTADVLREQLPRVRADYDLAALYAGVNEVRDPGFDLTAYERDLDAVAAGLAARVTRLLMADAAARPRPADVGAQAAARELGRAAHRRTPSSHGRRPVGLRRLDARPARHGPSDSGRPARDRRPGGARTRREGPAVGARRRADRLGRALRAGARQSKCQAEVRRAGPRRSAYHRDAASALTRDGTLTDPQSSAPIGSPAAPPAPERPAVAPVTEPPAAATMSLVAGGRRSAPADGAPSAFRFPPASRPGDTVAPCCVLQAGSGRRVGVPSR